MSPNPSPLGERSLVLIGYRATGKTSVGKLLAQALRRPFVDLDQELTAHAGRSVAEIVAAEGWEGFRRREKELVRRFAGLSGLVLATGGGVVLDPENVALLRETGVLVWLTATPETIRRRLAADAATTVNRPGLCGADPLAEVEELLRQREPLYRQAADVVIDTARCTPHEVADRVLQAVLHEAAASLTTNS